MESIDIGEKIRRLGVGVDFHTLCGKPAVSVAVPEPAKFHPYVEPFIPTIHPIRKHSHQGGMADVVLEMDSMVKIDIWKKKEPNPIPTKNTRTKLRTKNRVKAKQQAKDRKRNR